MPLDRFVSLPQAARARTKGANAGNRRTFRRPRAFASARFEDPGAVRHVSRIGAAEAVSLRPAGRGVDSPISAALFTGSRAVARHFTGGTTRRRLGGLAQSSRGSFEPSAKASQVARA